MQYMVLIASRGDEWDGIAEADRAAAYQRIEAWWGEHAAAGRIVEGHELQPADTATTVRVAQDGEATVTDGPFVEAKEMVGGYAIIDVPDLDAAISLVSSWPSASTLEIRPLVVREQVAG